MSAVIAALFEIEKELAGSSITSDLVSSTDTVTVTSVSACTSTIVTAPRTISSARQVIFDVGVQLDMDREKLETLATLLEKNEVRCEQCRA